MEVSHSLDFIILNIYFIIEIKMKIFVCILLAATVTQAGILETKSRRQKASPRAPSKSCQDAIKVSGYVFFNCFSYILDIYVICNKIIFWSQKQGSPLDSLWIPRTSIINRILTLYTKLYSANWKYYTQFHSVY